MPRDEKGSHHGGDGVDLIEEDDGRGKSLCALEDISESGLGLADPLGQERGAVDPVGRP